MVNVKKRGSSEGDMPEQKEKHFYITNVFLIFMVLIIQPQYFSQFIPSTLLMVTFSPRLHKKKQDKNDDIFTL